MSRRIRLRRLVQEAQAIALFGRARVAQERGQTATAGQLFQELKALYPWSPKVLEADYGIAQSLKEQGKLDEAVTLLTGLIRAPTATAQVRAKAMLLGGAIMAERGESCGPKQKDEFLGAAIDYFIKIAQFYGGVPTAASEGLWMGAQLLEQQANGSKDTKFKEQQLVRPKPLTSSCSRNIRTVSSPQRPRNGSARSAVKPTTRLSQGVLEPFPGRLRV